MSVKKFGKNRSVDRRYYNVPYKYILVGSEFKGGSKTTNGGQITRFESYEEWAERMRNSYFAQFVHITRDTYNDLRRNHPEALKQIVLSEKEDKTLCVVDFFGNKYALVGWRNNSSYSISMPKLCKLIKKNGKYYVKYKDKLIKISGGSGWVL